MESTLADINKKECLEDNKAYVGQGGGGTYSH